MQSAAGAAGTRETTKWPGGCYGVGQRGPQFLAWRARNDWPARRILCGGHILRAISGRNTKGASLKAKRLPQEALRGIVRLPAAEACPDRRQLQFYCRVSRPTSEHVTKNTADPRQARAASSSTRSLLLDQANVAHQNDELGSWSRASFCFARSEWLPMAFARESVMPRRFCQRCNATRFSTGTHKDVSLWR